MKCDFLAKNEQNYDIHQKKDFALVPIMRK